ncbi:MAG TPA: cytidylate kinase-like family protein [Verrucomicrobiae bacterium]|nr:cytidylate kinase-like family protein [Verrucomicrobiae bacterium]
MWNNIKLQQCISHINCLPQLETNDGLIQPSITISRMTGSGGRTVASKLADCLQSYAPSERRWTIFDRNLIQKVLEDHHLSARLAEFLPESGTGTLTEIISNMFKSQPSAASIVKQSVETIWKLAEGGCVVLVGRAANVITAGLNNVFHVRLAGTLEKRVARVETVYDFDHPAALRYIKSEDMAKKDYLKEYFGRDIDDPLLYDLVINTDELSYEKAARLIADSIIRRFDLEPHREVVAA